MKRLLIYLAVMFLFASLCAAQKIEYNRFDNVTTISTPSRYVVSRLEFEAYFTFTGQAKNKTITMVGLAFESSSRSWRFLENSSLTILVDGERLYYPEPLRYSKRLARYSGVNENLLFEIPVRDVQKIITARLVEVRLGSVIQFKFGDKTQGDLKKLMLLAQ